MNAYYEYLKWKSFTGLDAELKNELELIKCDMSEIEERFINGLEFGTGGLRGVIGAGTNRMNIYSVMRATSGLADYLIKTGLPNIVAIAYDSRINSDIFAKKAACVLAAREIHVYLYPRIEPTPLLSWAVRYFGCGAGICITASHNPSKYNGYKVYGPDGCQITDSTAEYISEEINSHDYLEDLSLPDFEKLVDSRMIDLIPDSCIDAYFKCLISFSLTAFDDCDKLKLVYTPLNGTGTECMCKLFDRMNLHDFTIVPEQSFPDGRFPTCPAPNPEVPAAMQLGIKLSNICHADILLGTDPDCDRCAVAVPDKSGNYQVLSGNEIGLLLFDFICRKKNLFDGHAVAITTIVSSPVADKLAEYYGVEIKRVLTGFKYIGEQIAHLESKGLRDNFIFGFEESYGYLSGTHVRDKDALNAAMIILEMAAEYKKEGFTLLDALEQLYQLLGYFKSGQVNYTYDGISGKHAISSIMDNIRKRPPAMICGSKVVNFKDYISGIDGLPPANVISLSLENGSSLIIRPSGTEQKIKLYLNVYGLNKSDTDFKFYEFEGYCKKLFSGEEF